MDWIQVKLTYEVFSILECFTGIYHNSMKRLNIVTGKGLTNKGQERGCELADSPTTHCTNTVINWSETFNRILNTTI
jgi:hypothetical protein